MYLVKATTRLRVSNSDFSLILFYIFTLQFVQLTKVFLKTDINDITMPLVQLHMYVIGIVGTLFKKWHNNTLLVLVLSGQTGIHFQDVKHVKY